MSKHTPGPWTVLEHSWSDTSVVGGTHLVCRMSIYDEATEDTQEELEARDAANARLIAAAPDLLRELKILRACLRPWIEAGHRVPGIATLNAADAAIAKATGEE